MLLRTQLGMTGSSNTASGVRREGGGWPPSSPSRRPIKSIRLGGKRYYNDGERRIRRPNASPQATLCALLRGYGRLARLGSGGLPKARPVSRRELPPG